MDETSVDEVEQVRCGPYAYYDANLYYQCATTRKFRCIRTELEHLVHLRYFSASLRALGVRPGSWHPLYRTPVTHFYLSGTGDATPGAAFATEHLSK